MILNLTRNKILSEKELPGRNLLAQSLGLMFRRKQNLVMSFGKEKKVQLHNFFVFYPIDVLILNEKQELIEIKKDFKPFTFWSSRHQGRYAVELAFPGEYRVGDKLTIK